MSRTEMEVLLTLYGWLPLSNAIWHEDHGAVVTYIQDGNRFLRHVPVKGNRIVPANGHEWCSIDPGLLPHFLKYVCEREWIPKGPRFTMTGELS